MSSPFLSISDGVRTRSNSRGLGLSQLCEDLRSRRGCSGVLSPNVVSSGPPRLMLPAWKRAPALLVVMMCHRKHHQEFTRVLFAIKHSPNGVASVPAHVAPTFPGGRVARTLD